MSAELINIMDADDNVMYPLSMTDDVGQTSSFDTEGNIVTALDNGYTQKVNFLDNGNIEEVLVNDKGKTLITRTTSFDNNGTITTVVNKAE